MKIGFAGRWSPLEKSAWSGTYYYSFQAIQSHFSVQAFSFEWSRLVRERLLFHKQFQKLIHKKAAVEFLTGYAKYFSNKLEKELIQTKVDLLFVPGAPQLIAYCNTSLPIIYMTDATFLQLQGYYPTFSEIADYNIRQGIAMDRLTFEKSSHCMLASDWALQSARKDYGIPEKKSSVIPLGANLDSIPESDVAKNRTPGKCRLLFLAVEWERKGGSLVLETYAILKKQHIPVQLTIIGCIPPGLSAGKQADENIVVIPFLNKHDPKESEELNRIFLETDFLFLPSRAECAGIVFCEAAAFGIPSITTDTGGISTYVKNGINGYTLPLNAPAHEYATLIESVFNNSSLYKNLCISSRSLYDETLNWSQWGNSFAHIASSI